MKIVILPAEPETVFVRAILDCRGAPAWIRKRFE